MSRPVVRLRKKMRLESWKVRSVRFLPKVAIGAPRDSHADVSDILEAGLPGFADVASSGSTHPALFQTRHLVV